MGVEEMPCCGALTKVYGDAGNREHRPGCSRADTSVSERAYCPDGGTCHHDTCHTGGAGCFRVRFAEPLSGVYPDDEWPEEVREEHAFRLGIPIPLTAKQTSLYRTSPSFKNGVDIFLRQVAPAFFDGLAAQAEETDEKLATLTALVEKGRIGG